MMLQRQKAHRATAGQRGAAVVEMAVVLPVLITIVLGIVEVGRVLMVAQTLAVAAREGVRVAVVDGSSNSEVESAVSSHLTNASISGATVSITDEKDRTLNLRAAGNGRNVRVRVTVPAANVVWVSPFFFRGSQVTGQCMMRHE